MIVELLGEGFENRVSREQLMRTTGLDERNLYLQIHKEREGGALIASTKKPGGGYYRPGNLEEMKAYERWVRSEAISLFEILKPLRAEIKRLEEEQSPEDSVNSDTDKASESDANE